MVINFLLFFVDFLKDLVVAVETANPVAAVVVETANPADSVVVAVAVEIESFQVDSKPEADYFETHIETVAKNNELALLVVLELNSILNCMIAQVHIDQEDYKEFDTVRCFLEFMHNQK